ncbi:MAG: TonB-dependent receptor, partial [Acidobacteria bacterium]|nr:TonB-dependent receptor [Acidobacteriota bacterium]
MLLLFVATALFAQTGATTSTLFGTVTTEGKPLPGVTVTISSPALLGTRTSVTGDGGGFTFGAVPPGLYTVQMTLEGMTPVTKKVTVSLVQPARADADLKLGAVTEAITVTAAAPAVLETTQVGANFTGSQIDKLPVARNIRQTVLLAPGVNPNGVNNQITISGGPSYDNVFLVNGVVVNENLRGQPHNLFIEDAIQETTVLTAGISAEYGRFTGGVVSTLTKSGGNEFTGSLRDSLTNQAWTDRAPLATIDPADKVNSVYEATLGGRIIRDRLWFFGAGRTAKTSVQRSTVFTSIPFVNGFDETRYEGKLTGQLTAKHNLVASYLDVANDETNNFFPDIYDVDSIVPSRSLPNSLRTANYNGIFTNSLLGELQWSDKKYAFKNSGGRFTDFERGTWIQDSVSSARMNAPVFCGVCTDEERNSDGYGGKVSYFLSTKAMGNHTLVAGGDRFHETRIVNNHQSGSDFIVSARVIVVGNKAFPRFDTNTQLTWQPILLNSNGTDLSSKAAFLNDRWDVNSKLTFNLGLRWDKNHAIDADGNLISDDSNISPRLGAMYDLRGDGRHRVSASFARYVAKITDGSNVLSTAQAAGSPGTFTWAYRDVTLPNGTVVRAPAVNPAGTPDGQLLTGPQALAVMLQWFKAIGGTTNTNYLSSSYPGYGSRFLDELQSPSTDEITVGYGTTLGPKAFARVDVVHRQWHDFYARQVNDPTKRIIPPNNVAGDLSLTVNDNEFTHRKYDAVELQAQWQPSRLTFGGNYTWSKLRGNDLSEGAGTATIRNTPGELFYPEYLDYAQRRPEGYLGQDRRHRLRMWAGYDLTTPLGNFNISALESYDSGFAYSAVGSIDATGRNANFLYHDTPKNPGYTLNGAGTTHDYYFSDRGAFRTDSRMATDLSVNYTRPIYGRFALFAQAQLLNVFNTKRIVDPSLINTNVITSRTG